MDDFEEYLQHLKDRCSKDDTIDKQFRFAVNIIWAKYHSSKINL